MRFLNRAVMVFAVYLGMSAHLRAGTPPPAEAVTELPTFVVDEKILAEPKESWRYAAVPGFEILANTSDGNSQRFLREFLKYRVVLGALFPAVNNIQDEAPTTLVLCGRGKSFDRFIPKNNDEYRDYTHSIYGSDRERTAIVLDMVAGEIGRDEDMRFVYDPYVAINREYFRFLLRKILGRASTPWFEAGMVRLVGATEFTDNTITFGRLGSHDGDAKIGSFHTFFAGSSGGNAYSPAGHVFPSGAAPRGNPVMSQGGGGGGSRGRAFLPMGKLFSSPTGLSPAERLTWEMQCYALVHMCILGSKGKLQNGLLQFVQRSAREPVNEALFKACFGKSYREMGAQLRGYVEFTTYQSPRLKLTGGEKFGEPPAFEMREASDAEIGRLKGDALRLTGLSDAARLSLIAPYARGERDPELLAALGLAELAVNQPERARKFLEKAYAGKTTRVLALIELARLRLTESRAEPAGRDAKLSPKQLVAVLSPLFAARPHKPVLADMYALIAEAWRHADARPSAAQLEVLDEGAQQFPRDVPFVLAAAEAYAAHGFAERTVLYATLGEKIAAEPDVRQRFTELKAMFPAAAAGTSP